MPAIRRGQRDSAFRISSGETQPSPAAASGYLTLFASDIAQPGTSTISFPAGQVRANNLILDLSDGSNGAFTVLNGSGMPTNVLLDVTGYFQ